MLVLLGPQRYEPSVREAFRALGVRGPIATVTAGWQERESEDDELREHLGCPVVELGLYRRSDEVRAHDTELGAALRERQERLRELQELYRLRLTHALAATRKLMRRGGAGRQLVDHRRSAIGAVRALDREHLRRLRRLHGEFETRWRPAARESIARHREQVRHALAGCDGVAIAGGHVSVLLNRLRLFDLPPLVGERPVVAWSAGAMALGESIVLFHDRPPEGVGNPEVFDVGLGMFRGVVPLPHAGQRLRLDDPVRVALFARRFSPSACVVLDRASHLEWDGSHWSYGPGTRALARSGRVRPIARS